MPPLPSSPGPSSPRRALFEEVLALGDIEIGGSRPWDLQVHDERVYQRVLADDALGLGESYMDGWWDAEALDEFFYRLLSIDLSAVRMPSSRAWVLLKDRLFNLQSRARARRTVSGHYDLDNDLFRVMLDERMTYTCGYWKDATTLDEAQEAKLDLVCRKLDLQPGQRVLDIGCGWGSFMAFAAERYGVSSVGVSISEEQVALGRERCAGLPVELRVEDYRDVTGTYDHVVSLGMFEHVGAKNYRSFFETAARCLAPEGRLLLHTIGNNVTDPVTDAWMQKYIFPGSALPSIRQIGEASERLFVMEDWHNFGPHYAPTLRAWYANVEAGWDTLRERYDERFLRMWRYYLLATAGSFRVRKLQLWQILFTPSGVEGGIEAVR